MALFGIRFDFRNPSIAATTMTERYAAALDMVQWADERGFVVVVLSEHHGCADGYLPSPLPMAAAMAARTRNIRIQIAALVASMHDPLRLAEDVAVVDLISGGRLDLVVTNGYVASEFAMFDRPMSERVRRTVELVETLKAARQGGPFEYRGRAVHLTPSPERPDGPVVALGGSTEPAARRAARIGEGFLPSDPRLWEYYRDEMLSLGKPDPGPYSAGDTSFFHIAEDPDRAWEEIAPYALHEVSSYGEWTTQAGTTETGGYKPVSDAEALRATGQYRVLTPDELVDEIGQKGPMGFTLFHPLMGGIPPQVAWRSLELFDREVLPRL